MEICFIFTPKIEGNDSQFDYYFSNGLVGLMENTGPTHPHINCHQLLRQGSIPTGMHPWTLGLGQETQHRQAQSDQSLGNGVVGSKLLIGCQVEGKKFYVFSDTNATTLQI